MQRQHACFWYRKLGFESLPRSVKELAVVVLAAGMGKRFKSELPKVMHLANGRPLLHHVLSAAGGIGARRTLVVTGTGRELVEKSVSEGFEAEFVFQDKALGTGDAVARCGTALDGFEGTVLVLNGDAPLITTDTLLALVSAHSSGDTAVTLLTAELADPTGYGRVLLNEQGSIEMIVEEADASDQEREISLVSTGTWCFDKGALFEALEEIQPSNVQGELYLPDAALVILEKTGSINTLMTNDTDAVMGVNDRYQLAQASAKLRSRLLERLASEGVTIEDPLTTYIDEGVEVGRDTVIRPLTFLEGSTRVGSGCQIGPSTRIVDSQIGDGVEISFAVIKESTVEDDSTVGPFASLRPGTVMRRGSKIGTFVETKATTIGEDSKVPHLSYVGDTTIGARANIGAGTITGNYDGETRIKSKTVIEDGVLTGSGTTIVAPATLGKDSVTGAGSVVTRDVAPEDVVVGVPAKVVRKRKKPRS